MRRHRIAERVKRTAGCLALSGCLLSGVMLLTGCGQQEGGVGETGQTSGQTAGNDEETVITGMGTGIQIDGDGAEAEGTSVLISQAGTYRLTGTVEGGQVAVETGENDQVTLILDGFSIVSYDQPAISSTRCGQLTIVLEEGTENLVADGDEVLVSAGDAGEAEGDGAAAGTAGEDTAEDSAADMAARESDAAVFSQDNLVLEGTGSLTVRGTYQEGIHGKDDVVINSGTYVIESVNDGIKGKDLVEITGGNITVSAGGDGIESDHDTDEEKGVVQISGGTVSVQAAKKGIKASSLVEITGGDIEVDADDDGIHSNGDVIITDGSVLISSGDDGIHADKQAQVSGGQITVTESYEGLEGLSVEITDGTISLTAQDDGINAAGGNDNSGNEGTESGGRENNPFAVTEGAYIRISGGQVSVYAGGDGIDSNGDFSVEGGTIYVEAAVSGANGILDFNGSGTITGGTFLGVGSAQMVQVFSEDSEQPVIVSYLSETQSAGTEVRITGEDGSQLADETPGISFEMVIFSSPELEEGKTYQLEVGETETEVTVSGIVNQIGEQSGFGGGFRGDPQGFGGTEPPERPDNRTGGTEPPERPGNGTGEMEPPGGNRPEGEPGGERPERDGTTPPVSTGDGEE